MDSRTNLAALVVPISAWGLICCGCSDDQDGAASTPTASNAVRSVEVATDSAESAAPSGQVSADDSAEPDPAVEAFRDLVRAHERNGEGWDAAQQALEKLGRDAIPALRRALNSEKMIERELATMTLAILGPDALDAADDLLKLLDDESLFIRANAAAVLSLMPEPPLIVLKTVTNLIERPQPEWQTTGIVMLRSFGQRASSSVPLLIAQLAGAESKLRGEIARTLGIVGRGVDEAEAALRDLVRDENALVRAAAHEALSQLAASPESASGHPLDGPVLTRENDSSRSTAHEPSNAPPKL